MSTESDRDALASNDLVNCMIAMAEDYRLPYIVEDYGSITIYSGNRAVEIFYISGTTVSIYYFDDWKPPESAARRDVDDSAQLRICYCGDIDLTAPNSISKITKWLDRVNAPRAA